MSEEVSTPKPKRAMQKGLTTPINTNIDMAVRDNSQDFGSPRASAVASIFKDLKLKADLSGSSCAGDDLCGPSPRKRLRFSEKVEEISRDSTEADPLTSKEPTSQKTPDADLRNSSSGDEEVETAIHPEIREHDSQSEHALDQSNKTTQPPELQRKRKKSPPPRALPPDSSEPQDSLTWHESEITGHLIAGPDDDGYGINGLGFKPTPAMAYARSQKRKQQIIDWRTREAREARQRRTARRGGEQVGESPPGGLDGTSDEKKRTVRFVS